MQLINANCTVSAQQNILYEYNFCEFLIKIVLYHRDQIRNVSDVLRNLELSVQPAN
jgi:hypothetical protein